eukprot:CAMPEP_0179223920 /NCGR_PEP_ID=MMETSP0797-20121207/7505_1 /TAXON_ID=47934 /ORGANISM="Dinophysis acuminata, Strain DAEP01" /LENGTH=164 /DNA_ID=CAMNT_0020930849 /DNA_START=63 /DNA_END=554 /DNA_ORIENTATION=-
MSSTRHLFDAKGVGRCNAIELSIVRVHGALLGIETTRAQPSALFRGLIIRSIIEGGLVAQWNKVKPSAMQVQPGDMIIKVNGSEGDEAAMAAELRECEDLRIMVQPWPRAADWNDLGEHETPVHVSHDVSDLRRDPVRGFTARPDPSMMGAAALYRGIRRFEPG